MLVGNSSHRLRGLALFVLVVSLLAGASTASARQTAEKAVHYHGDVVRVPRSWKVYDLSKDPLVCVRFDRHALYLGAPRTQQRCPAHAIGRTEAILVQPATTSVRRALARSASVVGGGLTQVEGSATTFVARPAGVVVTATWGRDESVVERALGQRSLRANAMHAAAPARAVRARSAAPHAHPRAALFGGLGFDACSTPSPASMAAWNASPYRAIGIYIGGVNAACAQPNLTSTWVAAEVAAGWHTVPIYVGLQAPSNGCRCAAISPSQAAAQGTAAAVDAVADAQGIGIPAGNPIYNDMEGYTRSSTNTAAVLAFLSAWTAQLHAEGYVSGVYSSSGSGISDLAAQFGTTYLEPDDIWFAEWNNEQTVTSSYVPPADWANNQRLHQYRGGHNETYGGVTINIDNDFLDGATADTSGTFTNVLPPPPPPTLKISPGSDGTTSLTASWNGGSGVASWRVLAGPSPTSAVTSVASAPSRGASSRISVRSAAGAFAVQALDATGQVLATSPGIAAPPHITIYGHSVFAPSSTGTGGIPVGCYTSATCHVKTTVFAGRTTIARTGQEHVGANGTGIVFFKLTSKGRSLLSHARGHRLAVNVKVQDSRGTKALSKMSLIAFATTGAGSHRSLTQASPLKLVGLTDFVSGRGVGGILAGCDSPGTCAVTTVVSVGRTVIARTGRELIGGNELGYLIFSLTSHGRTLLANAHGNQLGARVTITQGTVKAAGSISLVRFS
jgi:hypothetical protein